MRRIFPIFGAISHILSREETTELVKLLSLFEYFILLDDRLLTLHQWASVMQKQEERSIMRGKNCDDLPNLTFILAVSIFWEFRIH